MFILKKTNINFQKEGKSPAFLILQEVETGGEEDELSDLTIMKSHREG